MKKQTKQAWGIAAILTILALAILLYISNRNLQDDLRDSQANIEALTDSLTVMRNKDSSQTAIILAFQSNSSKDFLKIKSQDETIIRLQNLVRKYESKLKKTGTSATVISTNTNVNSSTPTSVTEKDTVIIDSLIYVYPEYTSNINMGGWITGTGISNKDTTRLNLQIRNDYDVVIGVRNNKYYADVTSHNPYTDIKTVRTYVTSPSKPKKLGLGINAGYGITINQKLSLSPYVGVGVNYNLIEF